MLTVWCTMMVYLSEPHYGSQELLSETVMQGKLLEEKNEILRIDFSDYAKKMSYNGNWSQARYVNKEECIYEKTIQKN